MSGNPDYTEYQPKPYRRPIPILWWLKDRSYFLFVVRELTSVFVAFFAALSLWQIHALGQGPEAYAAFVDRLGSPVFVAVNVVALLFVLYHAITWFRLVPKAVVLRFGEKQIPDAIIVGAHFLAWLISSAVVMYVLLRG